MGKRKSQTISRLDVEQNDFIRIQNEGTNEEFELTNDSSKRMQAHTSMMNTLASNTTSAK